MTDKEIAKLARDYSKGWGENNDVAAFIAGYKAALQSIPKEDNVSDGWISVKDRFPTKEETFEEFYNEVLTLQLGTKRPVCMKYWEIKNSPCVTYWMPLLPSPPKQ